MSGWANSKSCRAYSSRQERNVRSLVHAPDQPLKVFVGYAGWAAGQLDDEVEQGVWRIAAATAEQLFSESDDLWHRLSRQAFPCNSTNCSIPTTCRSIRRSIESC